MELKAGRIKSREIVAYLRRAIETGVLQPGEKISGSRLLAREFSAGRQVIRSAFDILEQEHLLEIRPQAGTFVSRHLPDTLPRRSRLNIALVNWKQDFTSRFSVRVYNTLLGQAQSMNCRILLSPSTLEELISWLDSNQVDGMILIGKIDRVLLDCLKERNIIYLVLGNYDFTETENRLEKDVAATTRNGLNHILVHHHFHRIIAVAGDSNVLGTTQILQVFQEESARRQLPFSTSSYISFENIRDYAFLKQFLDKSGLTGNDLLYSVGDAMAWVLRYLLEYPRERRPYLVLDMPPEEVPYPDLVGCFLCRSDCLAEGALEAFLNIYHRKVQTPWHGTCTGQLCLSPADIPCSPAAVFA